MKIYKKTVVLLIGIIILLSLAACSKKDNDTPNINDIIEDENITYLHGVVLTSTKEYSDIFLNDDTILEDSSRIVRVIINDETNSDSYTTLKEYDLIGIYYDTKPSENWPVEISPKAIILELPANKYPKDIDVGYYFTGIVEQVTENNALIRIDETSDAVNTSDLFYIPLTANNGTTYELQKGDHIKVFHDGMFLETYPAQIGNMYSIVVLETATPINPIVGENNNPF